MRGGGDVIAFACPGDFIQGIRNALGMRSPDTQEYNLEWRNAVHKISPHKTRFGSKGAFNSCGCGLRQQFLLLYFWHRWFPILQEILGNDVYLYIYRVKTAKSRIPPFLFVNDESNIQEDG